jgi:mono/diheme cytochrome c family protein
MKKTLPILIMASFLLVACGAYPSYGGMPAQGMGPTYSNNGRGNFASNGERIYFAATDNNGNYIPYTDGPAYGGMMMGGSLACVSCHGPNGQGGVHPMHMQTMDAPSITYDALVQMMVEESGGTPQPAGYTLEDFRRSVVLGQHPDGDQLDQDMPRWQLSDQDLSDLFEFIKTLP